MRLSFVDLIWRIFTYYLGPWIHNCVGHFNHRYFVLFMTYLVISCAYFVVFGWRPFVISLDLLTSEVRWFISTSQEVQSMSICIVKKRGRGMAHIYSFLFLILYYLYYSVAILFPSAFDGVFNDSCNMYGFSNW